MEISMNWFEIPGSKGVLDITTTEAADYVVGGIMACDASRFDVTIGKGLALVLSVGALDMVNFGAKDTIPSSFQGRKIYEHNKRVMILMSTFFHYLLQMHYFWRQNPAFLDRMKGCVILSINERD